MSQIDLKKILEDNGFEYYEDDFYGSTYNIQNIELTRRNGVRKIHVFHNYYNLHGKVIDEYFEIYIYFYHDINTLLNFGISCLDMDGYKVYHDYIIGKKFCNANDVIDELHRLNSIGQNIKG